MDKNPSYPGDWYNLFINYCNKNGNSFKNTDEMILYIGSIFRETDENWCRENITGYSHSEDNKNKDSGDDFEFGESYAESDKESPKKKGSNSNSGGGNGKGGKTTKVQNLPFDEAVEIASDEESDLGTSIDSIAEQNQMKNGDTPPKTNT